MRGNLARIGSAHTIGYYQQGTGLPGRHDVASAEAPGVGGYIAGDHKVVLVVGALPTNIGDAEQGEGFYQ